MQSKLSLPRLSGSFRADANHKQCQLIEESHLIGSKLIGSVVTLPFQIVAAVLWCAACLLTVPVMAVCGLACLVFIAGAGIVGIAAIIHFAGILLSMLGLV